jgi:predicted AlkP superfamily pyrophosphatase or phosphodiesterase
MGIEVVKMNKMFQRHFFIRFFSVVFVLLMVSRLTVANAESRPEIRLVLQITVDGLRGDLLNRYGADFGEDGFRYLLTNGAVFTNAHYQHANTETIVGHATLATGTFPSQHGMIGNVWFVREAGKLAYYIEAAEYPPLPSRDEISKGEQVDPSQKPGARAANPEHFLQFS